MIERLASENLAFELIGDGQSQTYAFTDDGVPAYIWFRKMQRELEGEAVAPAASPAVQPKVGERLAPT